MRWSADCGLWRCWGGSRGRRAGWPGSGSRYRNHMFRVLYSTGLQAETERTERAAFINTLKGKVRSIYTYTLLFAVQLQLLF